MKDRPSTSPSPVSHLPPSLNKGTLASLTTSKGKPLIMTEEDFPALGKKGAVNGAMNDTVKPETSYAVLAREWAKKKQEEEENGKKAADLAAIQAKLEYDDRVTRELSAKLKVVQLQSLQRQKKNALPPLEEDETYLPPPIDDYETYNADIAQEVEEEEEYDPTINYRRNKNELSTF